MNYITRITDTTESRKTLLELNSGESPTTNCSFSLSPPPLLKKREKPQVSGIPGIPPRERHRYRVTLGEEILGDRLTLDEAVTLANLKGVKS